VPHLLYVTLDLGFTSLIRRNAPLRCLLQHTGRCEGSILTQILTGLREVEVQLLKSNYEGKIGFQQLLGIERIKENILLKLYPQRDISKLLSGYKTE
jgi:hypothetical protein